MAQTGYTPIQLYYSSTTTNVPLAANLAYGELAINITDGKLFYKDNANAIQVIGWKVVPATAGGTGQTSYAVGDLIYANTTTTLAKLPDVATGNALISGGVNTAPSWGKIGLTTHVSGTLPIANGGTNQTAFTAKSGNVAGLVFFNSTSLANDTTVNNVGYDTSTNTLLAKNLSNNGDVALGNNPTGNDLTIAGASTLSVVTVGRLSSTSSDNTKFAVQNRLGVQTLLVNPNGNGSADITGTLSVTRGVTLCSATGDTNTGVGNIVQGTAAKGVNFTANTPNAGMTSQLMNWYEEGVVTVTLTASSSGTITLSGSYNTMRYVRIGRQVTVIGLIAVSSVSSPVGALFLNGMPFTSATGTSYSGSVSVLANGLSATAITQITGLINSNSTYLTLYKYAAGNVSNLAGDVIANSEFYVTVTYFV